MTWNFELASDPLTEAEKAAVVGVPELKRHLRISGSDEDRELVEYLATAYDFLSGPDGWLGGCCLLEQEWIAYSPALRSYGSIELPLRPLAGAALVGFDYLGSDGDYIAIPSDEFYLAGTTGFATIHRLPISSPWPYIGLPDRRAYRVRFVAGYGTERDDIPSPIRHGIKMLAGHWFGNRETIGEVGRTAGEEIPYGLKALCGRYRVSPDHS
jgi:uncharacterized phiE125 gp8 family phage protein